MNETHLAAVCNINMNEFQKKKTVTVNVYLYCVRSFWAPGLSVQ